MTIENEQAPAPQPPHAGPVSTLVCANCQAKNTIRPSPKGAPHCGKMQQAAAVGGERHGCDV